MKEEYEYDSKSKQITKVKISENGAIASEESYSYDFFGKLYKYSINSGVVNYSTEYMHDYNTGDDYLKYPGKNEFIPYKRDKFGRLSVIGKDKNVNGFLYKFEYKNGNIKTVSTKNNEDSEFEYDTLNRITKINNSNSEKSFYLISNSYDATITKTDNLKNQTVMIDDGINFNNKGVSFNYDYDISGRITKYTFTGVNYNKNIYEEESSRELIKNDYPGLPESFKTNRPWLESETEIENTDYNIEGNENESSDIIFDEKSKSLIISYDNIVSGIKYLKIKRVNNNTDVEIKEWLDFYYSTNGKNGTDFVKINAECDVSIVGERYLIVFKNPIPSLKHLKIHFNRDEINPVNHYLKSPYTSYMDTTIDTVINRMDISDDYKISGGSLIVGRMSDIIQVFKTSETVEETFGYDNKENRNELNSNTSGFDGHKIEDLKDKRYIYDNCGRRIVMTSRDGTWIYRYNLDEKLKKVYYSYNREPINDSKFNSLKNIGDNGFDFSEYKLIKEIKYSCSGLRIHEINNFVEKEEIIYYNTPFGYLGNKNITKNEERLLVNYISSLSGATANFESVSNDFGNASGYAYQSSMISYNGGNFGIERATMNQKIPVTIDGQALGEIKYNESTTDSLEIKWGSYNDQLSEESITIITSYFSTVLYNYIKDERGCVRAVTEKNGNGIKIKWNADYKPFGELLIEATTIDWLPLKTFALHEYDSITNLYYCQNRWYDAETGSFISEDPIKDGNNYYSYCENNPMGYVDPTGLYDLPEYASSKSFQDYVKRTYGMTVSEMGCQIDMDRSSHGNSFSLGAMLYSTQYAKGQGDWATDTRGGSDYSSSYWDRIYQEDLADTQSYYDREGIINRVLPYNENKTKSLDMLILIGDIDQDKTKFEDTISYSWLKKYNDIEGVEFIDVKNADELTEISKKYENINLLVLSGHTFYNRKENAFKWGVEPGEKPLAADTFWNKWQGNKPGAILFNGCWMGKDSALSQWSLNKTMQVGLYGSPDELDIGLVSVNFYRNAYDYISNYGFNKTSTIFFFENAITSEGYIFNYYPK